MKTTFRYEHLDHSPALEERFIERIGSVAHILEAYDQDDAVSCTVDFEKSTSHHNHGDVHSVRVTIDVNGHGITAHATGDDLYALVDEVKGTLHNAVQRFKEQDVARRHAEG